MIALLAALLIVCPAGKPASKPATKPKAAVHQTAPRRPEIIRVEAPPAPAAPAPVVLRERHSVAPWLVAIGALVAGCIVASQSHDRSVAVTVQSSSSAEWNPHDHRGHGKH